METTGVEPAPPPLTLGNGSARVELESFGGTISLRRPGEPRPELERERRRREKEKEKEKDQSVFDTDVDVDIDLDETVENAVESVKVHVDEITEAAMRVHVVPHPVPRPHIK